MNLFLVYLSIAVGVSFICSMLEAILLSVTPTYINMRMKEGSKSAHDLHKMKENIDRPLSAILTLNTFANTAGAAGVGAQAQLIWGNEALTLVSFLLTLTILFVSEIIPKTIGAVYWKSLTGIATPIIRFLVFILAPAVWISQLLTGLFKKDEQTSVLSKAEFSAMTEAGEKAGVFRESESAIIRNLLNFSSIRVEDIMTPRTVVIAAEEDMTLKQFNDKYPDLRFSRIPIFKETIDHISGFVLKDEILQNLLKGHGDMPLRELRRKIDAVPEIIAIPELFKLLLEKNSHIALVVDEYGGMAGIVTMEDLIETLLGLEITDETDRVEDLQEMARKNWERRARRLGLLHKKDKS